MPAPSVELYAPHPGYIERRAVANLAASLTRRGFEVSVKAPPAGVRYSTPWNVLLIALDHVADAAGIVAVVASAIGVGEAAVAAGQRHQRHLLHPG